MRDFNSSITKALICFTSGILACFFGTTGCRPREEPKKQAAQSLEVPDYCPQSDESWRKWRDEELEKLMSYSYTSNARHMGRVFQACQASLEQSSSAKLCLSNLERFTTSKMWQETEGHSLGLSMSDDEYFASVPSTQYFTLPDFLMNQEMLQLLDAWDSKQGIDKILEQVDRHNAGLNYQSQRVLAIAYRSQNIPSPDDTQSLSRFLFYIPGDEYSQFVQFALRDRISSPHGQSISMIVVQTKEPGSGEPLDSALVYFNDLYRVRQGEQVHLSTRQKENSGRLENCLRCHSTPVLPVKPDPVFFDSARFGKALAEVNQIINHYGSSKAAGFAPNSDGPGLLEGVTVTDALVKECAGSLLASSESISRVATAMNCASCHNGKTRGQLTLSAMSPNQLPLGGNLISHYVQRTKTMPPGADLSDLEREALVACLSYTYSRTLRRRANNKQDKSGSLERWLLQDQCHF